ncbi:spindle checkpoint protein [Lentinula guzmanii]|uniref:Spindle checkpoint protein n=2 Tax=Lentinula TaxID=5352 RepID=A0AA38JI09_9AGAR|nr:spindle checkpoint protein [Lentinula guzmanii]KAJ3781095.1 spindle checkpoint protein [Lentinula aff. detonsa]
MTTPPASSAFSAPSLTFNQTVRGITEFIEVAIHTILYVRQVYPAELFIRRKKYDTPVFQSRHPALNAYISGAVKAFGTELVTGNLESVVVVIKNKEEKALERFVFSVENMIQVEIFDKDISVEGAMSSLALGQYFRSFLVKLNMIEAQLGQMYLGDDVSFAILMELKDDMKPATASGSQEPPPWIPADQQHTTSGASDDAELHIVRAVSTGIINLSLVVQESDVKLSLISNSEALNSSQGIDKGKARIP